MVGSQFTEMAQPVSPTFRANKSDELPGPLAASFEPNPNFAAKRATCIDAPGLFEVKQIADNTVATKIPGTADDIVLQERALLSVKDEIRWTT